MSTGVEVERLATVLGLEALLDPQVGARHLGVRQRAGRWGDCDLVGESHDGGETESVPGPMGPEDALDDLGKLVARERTER